MRQRNCVGAEMSPSWSCPWGLCRSVRADSASLDHIPGLLTWVMSCHALHLS